MAQNQAPGTGAFSSFGIPGHQFGGVAIKPSLYGQSMHGSGPQNQAALAAMAPLVPVTAVVPQSTNAPAFGGPSPPYKVTDVIGPPSVRNSPGQQFDVYDFPSKRLADEATMLNAHAFIVVQSASYACPAGYTKF